MLFFAILCSDSPCFFLGQESTQQVKGNLGSGLRHNFVGSYTTLRYSLLLKPQLKVFLYAGFFYWTGRKQIIVSFTHLHWFNSLFTSFLNIWTWRRFETFIGCAMQADLEIPNTLHRHQFSILRFTWRRVSHAKPTFATRQHKLLNRQH